MIFRHCTVNDIDAFLEYQPTLARETTHMLQIPGRVPERTKIQAAWEASLHDPVELMLGVFVDSRMVAQLGFHYERQPPHPWTRHMGKFGMGILQEFWGEGLGRRMLEIMEEHAKPLGITRIEAQVRTRNERGVKLYTRMGYEIEGTRKQAAWINGEFQDEYFIAKILAPPNPLGN